MDNDRRWRLFERRLGMFVHWGIYSVGGVHEQEWMRRGMAKADYERYAERFGGERFDPDAWIDAAESFGAEYIVLTAKHHDGFCMWDTATTDWCVRRTPFGRDAVGELAAACRRRGMRLGLYYSNPDWHHPNAFNPRSTHQLPAPNPGDVPDMAKYRACVKAQIGELLTRYGEIVCLFWDIPPHIEDPEMNALARRLQPGIMINNRGWSDDGDYSTPERGEGDQGSAPARFTEVCDSLDADNWGYNANARWHTPEYLAGTIAAARAKGWNVLLNVGPRPDGTIPAEALALLSRVGRSREKTELMCQVDGSKPLPRTAAKGSFHDLV